MLDKGKFELAQLLKRTSFNNFLNLAINQGTNVIVALIINRYLYQTLGEEEYGLVSLALTLVMLLAILVNYGFHLNGPKRIAILKNDNVGREVLINEIIQTRIYISFVLIITSWAIVYFCNLFPNYNKLFVFSLVILLNEAIFPLFILQGLDRLSWLSKTNAIAKILYLVTVFLIVKGVQDSQWVNFLFGASALIVNLVLLVAIYKRESIQFYWVKLSKVIVNLRNNFNYFLSTIAGHVSIHGGLAVLGSFVNDAELGKYALAQRVAFLLRLVPTFFIQSILQKSSKLNQTDKFAMSAYLNMAFKGSLIVTFIIGMIAILGAKWIILIVGGEFVPYSVNVLKVLAFVPFLSALNIKNMIFILVDEKQDVLAKSTWVSAIYMLVASIYTSFAFGGIGLAFALLSTELVSFIVHSFWLFRSQREEKAFK